MIQKFQKWILLPRNQKDLLRQILYSRGIKKEKIDSFLNPDFEKDLYDPFLMLNLKKATELVLKCSKEHKIIGIYGDYDTDGATSAALLSRALEKLKITNFTYIPSRDEGYGINKQGIDKLISKGIDLLISVDCGVTNKDEIAYLNSKNIPSIIIDHHLVQYDKFPNTLVINPKQAGDKYPYKELSACGLVYKFVCALAIKYPDLISRSQLKWWLDLVALSTVADIVPLVDENRLFAFFGLKVISKTKNNGLRQLVKVSGFENKKISSGNLAFQIAPRINAPGRINDATLSYNLLVEKDTKRAHELALKLNSINLQRQDLFEKTLLKAENKIINDKLDKNKIILVAGKGWDPGIVGLVAGRITQKYFRPALVFGINNDVAIGSARSIENINLLDVFNAGKKYLISYGGHAKAGGLKLNKKNIEEFYRKILKYAENKINKVDLESKIFIDIEIKGDEIDLELAKDITKLEPFGYKNYQPTFLLKNQKIDNQRILKDKHLKFNLENGTSAIMFNYENDLALINNNNLDIVFSIGINEWANKENVQLNIIDLKISNEK